MMALHVWLDDEIAAKHSKFVVPGPQWVLIAELYAAAVYMKNKNMRNKKINIILYADNNP